MKYIVNFCRIWIVSLVSVFAWAGLFQTCEWSFRFGGELGVAVLFLGSFAAVEIVIRHGGDF